MTKFYEIKVITFQKQRVERTSNDPSFVWFSKTKSIAVICFFQMYISSNGKGPFLWVGLVLWQERTNNYFYTFAILLVPQWITVYFREGSRNMLFIRHNTIWILFHPILKLKVLNFEKCLSNTGLKLLKLTTIKSPIDKTLHFCELIARCDSWKFYANLLFSYVVKE